MNNNRLQESFNKLSTPNIVDACLRKELPFHIAPPGIRAVIPTSRIAGQVAPALHYGSGDVFFEAMAMARAGDILVIDNGGRANESCIGGLISLEASRCGLSGIVVWGCHRDTSEIVEENIPVFSYGVYPVGPRRLDTCRNDALTIAAFGDFIVSRDDVVFADCDGVVFVNREDAEEIVLTANNIFDTELHQAELIKNGQRLRDQFKFKEYLAQRDQNPEYTFGEHLRTLKEAAIGEQGI